MVLKEDNGLITAFASATRESRAPTTMVPDYADPRFTC